MYRAVRGGAHTASRALERQHQELVTGTDRVPVSGAGSRTAANIKGSVTRSRDNYLENLPAILLQPSPHLVPDTNGAYVIFDLPDHKLIRNVLMPCENSPVSSGVFPRCSSQSYQALQPHPMLRGHLPAEHLADKAKP